MRITIKIPTDGFWPTQYAGQEVSVDITVIKFPDGTPWSLAEVHDAARLVTKEGDNSTPLVKAIGFKPSRIVIES